MSMYRKQSSLLARTVAISEALFFDLIIMTGRQMSSIDQSDLRRRLGEG